MTVRPNTKNSSLSMFENLVSFGGALDILPPFDFTKNTLKKRHKLKIIGIILGLTLLNWLNVWATEIADDIYYLYLLVRFSMSCALITTLEPLVGSITRRKIWEEFFTECALLHQDIKCNLSCIEEHFYRNIRHYIKLFIAINVMTNSCSYMQWLPQLSSRELAMGLVSLTGDIIFPIYYNSYNFLISAFLNDIKVKYYSLSAAVLALEKEKNRLVVLHIINNVELKTLRVCHVESLIRSLFGLHFFLMILYAFGIGVEYCLFTYDYLSAQMTAMYFIFLTPIFICIYACDITHKAATKLTSNLLSVSNSFKEDPEIYEKLKDVSYKIRLLHKDFTAARFLNIDRKIAVSLLSAVGTYFLVIQQLYLPRVRPSNNATAVSPVY